MLAVTSALVQPMPTLSSASRLHDGVPHDGSQLQVVKHVRHIRSSAGRKSWVRGVRTRRVAFMAV